MAKPTNVVAMGAADTAARDDVLIHVRFNPAAEVVSIDARPEHLSAYDWYKRLREETSQECYATFAGGRGVFRIPRPAFEAIAAKA